MVDQYRAEASPGMPGMAGILKSRSACPKQQQALHLARLADSEMGRWI